MHVDPWRSAGESLDEEIRRWREGGPLNRFVRVAGVAALAGLGTCALLSGSGRGIWMGAWLFAGAAIGGLAYGMVRAAAMRRCLNDLENRREGTRAVSQCIDRLRAGGAQIFHDVKGDGCRLDHVIISRRGVFVVATRTVQKPWPTAKVYVDGRKLLVAGQYPDRDPRLGAAASARWVEAFLAASTGKRFNARAIVAFPGWYVQQADPPGSVWVVEPKALPALLDHEAATVPAADVALATWHLSRYVRTDLARAA